MSTQTENGESRSTLATGSASYRAYIHVLHSSIWEEREAIDLDEHDGLVNAFAYGMAKCQGISKRSGFSTRLMFVCGPNR